MPPLPFTAVPKSLPAGDSWSWTRAPGNYPIADGWILSYAIRGASALTWNADWATNDGALWTILLPAAVTKPVVAGQYVVVAYMTLGTDRYEVARHSVTVRPDAAQATAGQLQSPAERLLAACDAELERRVTGSGEAFESLTIRGRSITMLSIADIQKLRASAKARIRAGKTGRLGRLIRFTVQPPRG